MPLDNPTLSDDLLEGDADIATHMFGSATSRNKRRARALMTEILPVENRMPSFLLGGHRCSRKSLIEIWLAECRHREQVRMRDAAAAKFQEEEYAIARMRRRPGRYRKQQPPATVTRLPVS